MTNTSNISHHTNQITNQITTSHTSHINPATVLEHHMHQCEEILDELQGASNNTPNRNTIWNLISRATRSWYDVRNVVRLSTKYNSSFNQYGFGGSDLSNLSDWKEVQATVERIAENASPEQKNKIAKTLENLAKNVAA